MSQAALLDDLRPRQPGGLTRAAGLALLAHALLLVALSLGVSWRSKEPPTLEAELWAEVPQAAAPKPVEPEPATVTPRTEPPPPPTPAPRETPPPEPDAAAQREADIAREQQAQRAAEEREARERQVRKRDAEKREAERLAAAKRAEEKRAEDKRLEDKRQADSRAAREKEQADKERAERLEGEKLRKAEAERLARTEALRAETLKRITGQAGATGAPSSTGSATQSAGPSASYAGRIKARIKPNITFTDEVGGNPVATVEVKVAPDGTIVGRRLTQSSGVKAWDEAVLRAIDKTEVLPRDVDGRVPPSMLIDFRPRD